MIPNMPHKIDVSDLPEPLVEALETIVRMYREAAMGRRTSDRLRGSPEEQGRLPDSFSKPPPDEGD